MNLATRTKEFIRDLDLILNLENLAEDDFYVANAVYVGYDASLGAVIRINSDGYSLDDKRNFIDDKGDIQDIIECYKKRQK